MGHISTRVGGGPGTFFSTHGNHLPWLSGVHGLKDFLWSDHLHGSFDGRIYSLKHFNKCKFVHQRTQEDEHYRKNPSNHELLTVRGGDCRASKKMFRGLLPPYCRYSTWYWQCVLPNYDGYFLFSCHDLVLFHDTFLSLSFKGEFVWHSWLQVGVLHNFWT